MLKTVQHHTRVNMSAAAKNNDIFLAVISHNRQYNVGKMKQFIGDNATWFVGKTEADVYELAGADSVVESGGLVDSRNAALTMAKKKGKICVLIDDDLKAIKLASDTNTASPINFFTAINLMKRALLQDSRGMFYLAGTAPTDNAFYYHKEKPHTFDGFIGCWLMMVRPECDLYFDSNLHLKEDYDYTLQHVAKYGGAVRLNNILATFSHYDNKGGVVDYRTAELEQQTIAYLKKKWGNVIKDNPRRKNEILLRVKK
jgi:hypothetical protein